MEYLLDTVDLEEIKRTMKVIPVSGLTSTPSIIFREGKIDFIPHMKKTRELITEDRTLHMQVVAKNAEGMINDSKTFWEKIDKNVYSKIPLTEEGFKALKHLKSRGNYPITATAVYSKIQALLAIELGADYIAVYSNRSVNVGVNPFDIIKASREYIDRGGFSTKIMASSIKNIDQITNAAESGADAVTFAPEIIYAGLNNASVKEAVDNFTSDWVKLYKKEMIY